MTRNLYLPYPLATRSESEVTSPKVSMPFEPAVHQAYTIRGKIARNKSRVLRDKTVSLHSNPQNGESTDPSKTRSSLRSKMQRRS